MSDLLYLRDPRADGVGVAFTSAALDLGDRQGPAARAGAAQRVADALGVPVAVVAQVHGADVLDVDEVPSGPLLVVPGEADALVTGVPGLALAVRVADCIPILIADPEARLVAAVHAGRAGVLGGVIEATVRRLHERGAGRLTAWVGPHVCGSCYEVPSDMAVDFELATGVPPTRTGTGTTGIDIGAAALGQLERAGVTASDLGICTLHDEGTHSFRRDGASSGRLAGLVWLAGR